MPPLRAESRRFVLHVLVFSRAASAAPDKKDKQVGRLLFGKVLDPQDNPVPDAVVYVTNTRTRAVKTYIVGKDGTYRFPALSSADRLRGLRSVQRQKKRHQVGQPVR